MNPAVGRGGSGRSRPWRACGRGSRARGRPCRSAPRLASHRPRRPRHHPPRVARDRGGVRRAVESQTVGPVNLTPIRAADPIAAGGMPLSNHRSTCSQGPLRDKIRASVRPSAWSGVSRHYSPEVSLRPLMVRTSIRSTSQCEPRPTPRDGESSRMPQVQPTPATDQAPAPAPGPQPPKRSYRRPSVPIWTLPPGRLSRCRTAARATLRDRSCSDASGRTRRPSSRAPIRPCRSCGSGRPPTPWRR